MSAAQWILPGLLFGFFVFGAGYNRWHWKKSRAGLSDGHYAIPFLPGLAGAIALWLLPFRSAHYFVWLPPLLDACCAPLLLLSFSVNGFDLLITVCSIWFLNPLLRTAVYCSRDADAAVMLKLYRNGRFAFENRPHTGHEGFLWVNKWTVEKGRLLLGDAATYDVSPVQTSGESPRQVLVWSPDSPSDIAPQLDLELVSGRPLTSDDR
jgi:hypothetical protein